MVICFDLFLKYFLQKKTLSYNKKKLTENKSGFPIRVRSVERTVQSPLIGGGSKF